MAEHDCGCPPDCTEGRMDLNGYICFPPQKIDMGCVRLEAKKFPCSTTLDQLAAAINGLPDGVDIVGMPLNMGNDGWVLVTRKYV